MNKTINSDLIPELNDIKWKNERRKVKDLKEYGRNPRVLTKTGLEHLTKSITKFNIADPIIINTDGTICGGHGRIKVLKKMGVKEVDVRVPEEALSDEDFAELNIRLNKNIAGEFDMDMLSTDFEMGKLAEYGFEAKELGIDVGKDEEEQYDEDPNNVNGDGEKQITECPECGCKFSISLVGKTDGSAGKKGKRQTKKRQAAKDKQQ